MPHPNPSSAPRKRFQEDAHAGINVEARLQQRLLADKVRHYDMGVLHQVAQRIGEGFATLNKSSSDGVRDVGKSDWGKKLGVGPAPFTKVGRRHLRVPGGTPFTLWYPLERTKVRISTSTSSQPEVAAKGEEKAKKEDIAELVSNTQDPPAPWFKDASYFFTGYVWMLGWRYFADRPLLFTIVRRFWCWWGRWPTEPGSCKALPSLRLSQFVTFASVFV